MTYKRTIRLIQRASEDVFDGSFNGDVYDPLKYELVPTDSHKSFWKKAHVVDFFFRHDGNEVLRIEALFSYSTLILARVSTLAGQAYTIPYYAGGYDRDINYGMWGVMPVYSDDVSPTTLRHIKAFTGMNKGEYKRAYATFWNAVE